MGFFGWLKGKSKSDQERSETELQQALILSRNGKHVQAYPMFEKLYLKNSNATNTFNLFQCAVYCGKTEVENQLYEKLKCYSPNPKKEPMELSGCFVRYSYAYILCDVGRSREAIEIIDYLIDVISHYKITDPTFLYIRGILYLSSFFGSQINVKTPLRFREIPRRLFFFACCDAIFKGWRFVFRHPFTH